MFAFDDVNKKNDAKSSKLHYEITAEPQQSIIIDMEKGTVSKG
jgi:hypothetical protein